MTAAFSSADPQLAARLEAAEAQNGLQMARAAANVLPEASYESFAGGTAVFAGVESPMTHAVGIGLRGHVPEEEMERMEAFFRDRGSACLIDLCPLADPSVIAFVQARPYRILEFNNVLARRVQPGEGFDWIPGLRTVADEELPLWSRIVSQGFAEPMPVNDQVVDLLAATCKGNQCWLAENDRPVAGAAMGIQNSVALFFGDATITAARRQGWHSNLIRARLASAERHGCDLAMASVLPGSASHKNYERAGFQLIYMRVNLAREL